MSFNKERLITYRDCSLAYPEELRRDSLRNRANRGFRIGGLMILSWVSQLLNTSDPLYKEQLIKSGIGILIFGGIISLDALKNYHRSKMANEDAMKAFEDAPSVTVLKVQGSSEILEYVSRNT